MKSNKRTEIGFFSSLGEIYPEFKLDNIKEVIHYTSDKTSDKESTILLKKFRQKDNVVAKIYYNDGIIELYEHKIVRPKVHELYNCFLILAF